MGEKGPLFILAGNGPYENRGCEAIVRGTMEILREYFQDPRCVCLSHFQNEDQFIKQVEHETNDAIIHLASRKLSKKRIQRSFWKLETWHGLFNYYFDRNAFFSWVYRDMLPYLNDTAAVLSVAGSATGYTFSATPMLSRYSTVADSRTNIPVTFRIWSHMYSS